MSRPDSQTQAQVEACRPYVDKISHLYPGNLSAQQQMLHDFFPLMAAATDEHFADPIRQISMSLLNTILSKALTQTQINCIKQRLNSPDQTADLLHDISNIVNQQPGSAPILATAVLVDTSRANSSAIPRHVAATATLFDARKPTVPTPAVGILGDTIRKANADLDDPDEDAYADCDNVGNGGGAASATSHVTTYRR